MLDPRLIMAGDDWDVWMWMWTDVATPVNDEKARPKPTIAFVGVKLFLKPPNIQWKRYLFWGGTTLLVIPPVHTNSYVALFTHLRD